MSVEARRGVSPFVLAAGDAVAVILFAVIGLANHEEGITAGGIARNALPILAAFVVVAPFAGTYARPGLGTLLVTWAIAVPIGVVIRAIVLDRPADGSQVTFGIVTMIATLVLLLSWRGIAALGSRIRSG
ncbi:MAG TPA: DUF3054 domain-containing protein [Actinomycetota bacterium]|nr:DUF3054 domain-containing protein [Actinomycetota bacterium]